MRVTINVEAGQVLGNLVIEQEDAAPSLRRNFFWELVPDDDLRQERERLHELLSSAVTRVASVYNLSDVQL